MKTYGVIGLPRKRREEPELELHAAIAQYLDAVLAPPAIHTAVPAGGGGSWHGKRQKRKGYRAGWPDHQIVYNGRLYAIEIKHGKTPTSDAQVDTIAALKLAGCPVAIVHSVEELREVLKTAWWAIPTRERRPTPVDALRARLEAER